MNIKSERGQAEVAIVLLLAIIALALLFMSIAANQHGMQAGADTIGDAVGDAIDDPGAEEQEWRNIEWQVQHGIVARFWVNQQRIYPNKHSIEEHAGDAWLATNCYNDHGAFMVMRSSITGDFYLPCREEDGTVRLTVWKRESATSNRFHMESAYTPKNGIWKKIESWLRGYHKATKVKNALPPDITLVIDGIIP